MKINEIKHNHSLTDLLKVLLFSILMLLPFLDVGTRCAYVIANKNAYQSYSNEIVESQPRVSNTGTLGNGLDYIITFGNLNNTFSGQNGTRIYYSNATIDWTTYGAPSGHTTTAFQTYINANHTSYNIYLYEGTNNYHTFWASQSSFDGVSFTITMTQDCTLNGNETFWVNANIKTNVPLDNVFEYSVSQLESSNLYNWTTQTAIYSGVSQMTSQLGITGNIIPIILCYWFFITIIYIILDIVIKLFTILTHFIGSKTSS